MKSMLLGCLICLPLRHLHLNSGYGFRIHPLTREYSFHYGIDLRARHDTVFAIADGEVEKIGYENYLGNYIRLRHDSLTSIYSHLSRILVGKGEPIAAGEPIAITGATGRVTGEHLHFSLVYQHHYIDPVKFLYQMLIRNHE